MANQVISTDWDWTQGNYGFSLIFKLIDLENLKAIDVENHLFYVAVQRGESIRNSYIAPCKILDADEKKVEYVIRDGDLNLGDEYYYIELFALHADLNPNDTINDARRISAQQLLRVFVKRKLGEGV